MKKSNLILLAILAVATIAFLWFSRGNQNSTLETDPEIFQIPDSALLTQIFLTDLSGHEVKLTRKKQVWYVGESRAEIVSIKNAIEPLIKMRIKAPVSDQHADAIIKDLSASHIKLELYDANGLIKTLFIGEATQDGLANYAYLEGSERPFVVHIPGWNGNLKPRYFTNANEWKSTQIFPIAPQNIKRVEVNYPSMPDNSFVIHVDENGLPNVEPLSPMVTASDSTNDRLAKEVLFGINSIHFEQIYSRPNASLKDSVLNILPVFAKVVVESASGATTQLVIKEKPASIANIARSETQEPMDQNRFFSYVDNGNPNDIGSIQRVAASKILKQYDKFQRTK